MSTENLVPNLSDCVVDSENKTGGIGLREIHVWQLSTQSATTVLIVCSFDIWLDVGDVSVY